MNLVELKESQGLRKADRKWYSRTTKFLLFAIDLVLVNCAFLIVNHFQPGIFQAQAIKAFTLSFHVIVSLTWIGVALFNQVYKLDGLTKLSDILWRLILAFLLHLLLIGLYVITNPVEWSFKGLALFYIVASALVIPLRFLSIYLYKRYKNLPQNIRKVVIVGARSSSLPLFQFFTDHFNIGYRFLGFFDDSPASDFTKKDLIQGNLKSLKQFCVQQQVDEIYYALPLENKTLLAELAEFSDKNFIYFRIVPDFNGLVNQCLSLYFYDNLMILTPRQEPLRVLANRLIKRMFDIVFSSLVIFLIFPFIFPLIALVIKIESKGDIFFKQMRPGFKNQLFLCYKFRTMRQNPNTEKQAEKNDPRVTRFGKFMRKTSIDELPQFFNVLKGDMSVVGPRPNMVRQLEFYSKSIDKYAVRHFIKPGITGFAQINGYRGETREIHMMEKRVEYDVKYIENWSLALDCKIILWTILNIFKGEKNAY